MSNISQWSTAAASNDDASPDGAPEGMAPSGVNDTLREMMAATARWYQDLTGNRTTTGSGNAFALTTSSSHAALTDQNLIIFRADRANTGAATLNVDSLGALDIVTPDGSSLPANTITTDGIYLVAFDELASPDRYVLLSKTSDNFAGTGSSEGAALIGLPDTAGLFSATNVEDGLAEARGEVLAKTSATSRSSDTSRTSDPHLAGFTLASNKRYMLMGELFGTQNGGNISMEFDFTNTPQGGHVTYFGTDSSGGTSNIHQSGSIGGSAGLTALTDGAQFGIRIGGGFESNISTGGTLDFQWAQTTSDADATELYEHSWIHIIPIND